MANITCSECNSPIKNVSIRLFIDDEKKKQVCNKCWKKACEERFADKKSIDKITINKIIRK